MKTFKEFLEEEQLDEISTKTLQDYRQKAHTQIQHYKYASGKDKPEASKVLAKREPGMKRATDKVIKKEKERIAALPKREPQKIEPKYPLGGRDEKSGRSYSEENDMCTVCGQTPCNCTHVEQIDELSKDTLKSYLGKAKTNYNTQSKRMSRAYHQDVDKYDDASIKRDARKAGIKSAKAKLAKEETEQIDELSSELLAQYKKKASDAATAADKAGKYDIGHKRFKGIIKATFKQFANDAKKK